MPLATCSALPLLSLFLFIGYTQLPLHSIFSILHASAFNNFRHGILSWVTSSSLSCVVPVRRCQIECNVCVCEWVCVRERVWRHQLEKVSVGKALNLCWLLCVYLSMYNTLPFSLHLLPLSPTAFCLVAPPPPPSGFQCLLRCKSHLYRCIWLLSLGQRPRSNSLWLSWFGLAA